MRSLLLPVLMAAACVAPAWAQSAGPRLMSTNICADVLALSLADPSQIISLSRQSQDAKRFSMVAKASQFAANEASAEDVLHLKPDVVLASRRWNARHQQDLLKQYGVRIVTVPFPTDWQAILDSTLKMGKAIGRETEAKALVQNVQSRLAKLQASSRPLNALYLRPNGGSAGTQTHVDAVLAAAGLRNHATALGLKGWGRLDMERILMNPPDVFITPSMVNDTAYAKSALSRHPQMKALLSRIPVVTLTENDWGCSNWQLIEAAEAVAAQLDALGLSGATAKGAPV
ncbi:ABC transporter substrate-binding protein [Comamonas sp. lk]|uniref:ABC transporter substrate-binding protein n=1 Tax=Comamonas sp. lk TaxID=2201272 RepID=UPI000EABB231|nr:ABC transporter substrate-binding protein [Comamonas sp. lk]